MGPCCGVISIGLSRGSASERFVKLIFQDPLTECQVQRAKPLAAFVPRLCFGEVLQIAKLLEPHKILGLSPMRGKFRLD